MILALTGIGINAGIAIGRVHRLGRDELEIPEYHIAEHEVDPEIRRFRQAVRGVERYLDQLQQRLDAQTAGTMMEFLQAHRLMLHDEWLFDATCQRIREERLNAEWALSRQHETLLAEFERIEDEYLAARREDIEQVAQLIQHELAQAVSRQQDAPLTAHIPHRLDDTVVVAASLAPSELAILHERGVAGLVTEHGSPWAHTAIAAKALEIPTVVGAHHAARLLAEGESVILDGHYGVVLAGGDESLARHYRDKHADSQRHRAELARYRDRPDRTRDKMPFTLMANADTPAETDRARELGATGVGLMRTEFLFMGAELPSEDTQYEHYRAAVEAMRGRPVTIRTLDAGGDKPAPGLMMMMSPNPALGLRGLRLSLSVPEVFRTQLRAVLRASQHGPVRLLLPMVCDVGEVRRVRELLSLGRQELHQRGISTEPEIAVGGMIEVPAAAIAIDALAAELDFFSIGTNDLIQYLLAIDRQDELVSHLYNPVHPAVLTTLAGIVARAKAADRPVSVCGELAGDEHYTRLLLGLGVREFSMPPGKMLAVKKLLTESHARRCHEIVTSHLGNGLAAGPEALLDALAAS